LILDLTIFLKDSSSGNIEKLKALNAKDKAEYHDFALKCLKGYIENNPSWRKDIIDLQALLGFDPELDEYDMHIL
jgi:hypothetical protein